MATIQVNAAGVSVFGMATITESASGLPAGSVMHDGVHLLRVVADAPMMRGAANKYRVVDAEFLAQLVPNGAEAAAAAETIAQSEAGGPVGSFYSQDGVHMLRVVEG